ncbi:Uncharacterized protein TCM_012115 [Theobroma cacao]|uniref:Reverse transcriptase Ty1/copia-type domain-containing protein n=1 Tax=Theobroma cacao TaxID=3641 RepID=A0A061FU97_THECC|nr:Uncharacterized protein TCM_012115 [Theobroma cacao]
MVTTSFSTYAFLMFNEDNYAFWVVKIKSYLKAFNLWDTVETKTEPVLRNVNPTIAQLNQHEEDIAKRSCNQLGHVVKVCKNKSAAFDEKATIDEKVEAFDEVLFMNARWNWEKLTIEHCANIRLVNEEAVNEEDQGSDMSRAVRSTRSLQDIYVSCNVAVCEPTTYSKATKDDRWLKTMGEEMQMILKNGTWILTFAPVARHDTIRLLTALAAKEGLQNWHLDVKSAFLNGFLTKDIYALRARYERIDTYLTSQGSREVQMSTHYMSQMEECKPVDIPLAINYKLSEGDGSLSAQPSQTHYLATKRVLRYIKGIFDYGLKFEKKASNELVGFCDSDWAGSVDDSKSTTSSFKSYDLVKESHIKVKVYAIREAIKDEEVDAQH